MVRNDGYVKIVDFGLATLLLAKSPRARVCANRRSAGAWVLHLRYSRYMALSEFFRGESPGPPSDIFSFGLVFCEMATGRSPFSATSIPEVRKRSSHSIRSRRAEPQLLRRND